MSKFRIDKAKTFLPQSIAKGSTETRLQKARLFNIRFYQNLQDYFEKREVKDTIFKRTLQETCGTKVALQIFPSATQNSTMMGHTLTSKSIFKGYTLLLPFASFSRNIRQSTAGIFLSETQRLFNEAFNPKFFTRKLIIANQFQHLGDNTKKFYDSYLKGTQTLTKADLNEFLKDRPIKEQINFLQMFRYDVMSEKNIEQAKYQIDKQIEKFEHLQFGYKDYNLEKFHYDEKLAILNEKLKSVLQTARAEIQSKKIS